MRKISIPSDLHNKLTEIYGDDVEFVVQHLLQRAVDTPVRQLLIARDAKTGLYTSSQLAERYGLSKKTIETHLERAGVSLLDARRAALSRFAREKESN